MFNKRKLTNCNLKPLNFIRKQIRKSLKERRFANKRFLYSEFFVRLEKAKNKLFLLPMTNVGQVRLGYARFG